MKVCVNLRFLAAIALMIALLECGGGSGNRQVSAQGTHADYARAQALAAALRGKVYRDRVSPRWDPDGKGFWYRAHVGPARFEFVRVDAEAGTRAPAFDHDRLARSLSQELGRDVLAQNLPLDALEFEVTPVGPVVRFNLEGERWSCTLTDYALEHLGAATPVDDPLEQASAQPGRETEIRVENATQAALTLVWLAPGGERREYATIDPGASHAQHTYSGHAWVVLDKSGRTVRRFVARAEPLTVRVDATQGSVTDEPRQRARGRTQRERDRATSPDGRWTALVRDHNLVLRANDGGNEVVLTRDGTAGDAYRGPFHWSPDSKRLVAIQEEPGEPRKVHYVEAAPRDRLQPRLHEYEYAKPGDRIARPRPRLFDVEQPALIPIDESIIENPWSLSEFRWAADSSRFTFLFNQRGHQVLRLLAVDAHTGAVSTLIEERSATFVDYPHKVELRWLETSNEIVWMSERSGWNHLWLIDGRTGDVKNPITQGAWVVRRVLHVDEPTRQVWFLAGGVRPEQDPYYLHLCRAHLDGSGMTILTEGDGTHDIAFSPDRTYFIDSWSRVDQPPIVELRASQDGRLVARLETAETPGLDQAGWMPPERFAAKGRDGVTDIHGLIIKPSNFDPSRRYPVIEEIYAGPHGQAVPKAWGILSRQQALAELGFVVVQIDGMGTNWRSKAFHDVCWKNLRDAGFPDRIAWLKEAARTRPWMDLSRVGIYGGSAGGQNAMRALLDHGDFYHVAVADCGCHDNRMDKIWWNELWMGWPVGPEYAASSNVVDAHRLKGKLMLIVGEKDTNVDPASTLQVVDALVRADKDFELLVMPGVGHGAAETPYGHRRRMDFLVRHLLGVEPRGQASKP